MKALRVVVPLLVAGALVLGVVSRVSHRSEADAYRLQREAARREMIERSLVARGADGPAGIEEARAVLRWWLDASSALRKRFPAPAADEDAALTRRAPTAREGRNDAAAWFRYAQERVGALRGGYSPVLTGSDRGVRLDVLAVVPGEHPDTHERALRVDFALWGAPRRVEHEAAAEGQRPAVRVAVPLAFPQVGFRFLDAAGKTYGEMTGSGEPYLLLKDPERFSNELPPGIAFGTWWIEPFPREAVRVELTIAAQVQGMTAAMLAPTFRWELPVPEPWKLRPGETFRAESRAAPPEPPARK